MTQTNTSSVRVRPWPDMSSYGIHFGVLEMPNGEARMVMVDQEGAWSALAQRMGFTQSRWFGLYVKSSLKLDIPGFKTSFPSAKVLQLTDQEIRARIKPLILERRDHRLSKMHPGKGRLSWHPTRTEVADAAGQLAAAHTQGSPEDEEQLALSPEAALRQTQYLGMNHLGQDVFESGDSQRFARSGDQVVARESKETGPSPAFLRSSNDEDLVAVAAGMVREIDAGKRLHSDDFIRFIEAAHGLGSSEDKDSVGRFHAALDRAMMERISAIEGAGQDAFTAALRLHEGRPSFWRAAGSWSTPLPIAVVMQSLATARIHSMDVGTPPAVIDITGQPRSHSWAMPATSVSGGEYPSHDIALAGVFGQATRVQSINGVRVTRADTEALMSSLEKRSADGLTIFVVTAEQPGRLDSEFRRAISAIGQKFEVTDLLDLDASLIGPGSTQCSRLVVIGRKRKTPDHTFAVPTEIKVVYDYGSLWGWSESLRAAQLGESETFGDDGREENRWQAPYIPSSQVSEPEAMSPRNMLGPVRMALARIVEKSGMGIDEFVCSRIGWTMEELERRLSAEQTDAVAIGIQAIDDGAGMVEGDATGLGKGRVAATLAVYGKRIGKHVVFMTSKADLFTDFYRDVADIECMESLGKPFIVNNDLILRDVVDGKEFARSPSANVAHSTMACGEFPDGHDLVLATYSQFNRKYDPANVQRNTAIAIQVRALINGAVQPFEALLALRAHLELPDYAGQGLTDQASAIAYEKAIAAAARANHQSTIAQHHEDIATLLGMDQASLLEQLSELIKTDLTTIKHQWLYSGAMNDSLVILDECHVAAGADSQTGVNIRHLVENAAAAIYSSATFAKDIGNFLLYSRLFPGNLRAASIGETLKRGGESLQEIISGMLAKDGRLVRREHDLSNLEFKLTVGTDYQARNEVWANGFAKVLASMGYLSGQVGTIVNGINDEADALFEAAVKAGKLPANIKRVGVQYTNFASKFYGLSRAFMMAVNADLCADLAVKALREGRKPVITVENTMESVLRELVNGVDLDDGAPASSSSQQTAAPAVIGVGSALQAADPLAAMVAAANGAIGQTGSAADPLQQAEPKGGRKAAEEFHLNRTVGFKDILHAYVDSMFTANEQVRVGRKLMNSTRISLGNPNLEAAAQAIRKLIDDMPMVPLSSLDMVQERIRSAGFSVGEISGRRLELKTRPDGTHMIVRMAERKKQLLKKAFNSGDLDALILSKSGSTGISLHASRTFSDQRQRELIELQVASDIAERLQFWGRVNRKGQSCSPIIHMVASGLPAEMRLITMQNANLRRLSANISGNADNSALNEDAPDILNRIGNEVCFRWLETNPKVSSLLGFDISKMRDSDFTFSGTRFVDMLTGRLMMLDVDTQRRVYREITAEFKALMEEYELSGVNPLKSAEYDLRAAKTGTLVLQVATGVQSVFEEAVQAVELTYPISLPALNREECEAAAVAGREALTSAYGSDFAGVVAHAARTACDVALPNMLAARHSTVLAALTDKDPNAAKGLYNKIEWLCTYLSKLTPGSILAFTDSMEQESKGTLNLDGRLERIFVTGWRMPQANLLSMAEYKLQGYSANTRKRIELSFSSLYSRNSFWVETSHGVDKPSVIEADLKFFFERLGAAVSGHATRIVLEGNLFRAAEIAESQKEGTSITYTDERGIWNHAVLMPKQHSLRTITSLPVNIDCAETLSAAFASVPPKAPSLVVSDDLRDKGGSPTYKLSGTSSKLAMKVTGNADSVEWLTSNSAMKACLTNAEYKGSRKYHIGEVVPGKELEYLNAFMKAANLKGVKVMMGGHMREWFNDHHMSKLAPEASQQAVDAALNGTDDDDLSALLTAKI